MAWDIGAAANPVKLGVRWIRLACQDRFGPFDPAATENPCAIVYNAGLTRRDGGFGLIERNFGAFVFQPA